jgi:ribosomal protein S18 acetylase RimI-like enzyme
MVSERKRKKMGDTAAIRLAVPGDLAEVTELTRATYAPYEPVLGGLPVPAREDYAPRIARGEVWLLCEAGKAAALAVLERHPDHLMIYSLAVRPGHQGRGLGRRLLHHAEARARAEGLSTLHLYTNSRMERNIAIYRQAGFAETGRRPHPLWPGQTVVDMARHLDPAGAAPQPD